MIDNSADEFPKVAVGQLDVELTDEQAMACAQFLKHVSLTVFREHAVNDDEAYLMQEAMIKLQKAFEQAGYAPR